MCYSDREYTFGGHDTTLSAKKSDCTVKAVRVLVKAVSPLASTDQSLVEAARVSREA